MLDTVPLVTNDLLHNVTHLDYSKCICLTVAINIFLEILHMYGLTTMSIRLYLVVWHCMVFLPSTSISSRHCTETRVAASEQEKVIPTCSAY